MTVRSTYRRANKARSNDNGTMKQLIFALAIVALIAFDVNEARRGGGGGRGGGRGGGFGRSSSRGSYGD